MSAKIKSVVLLLAAAILTGCVAAVVTSAVAGMVYDRRGVITMEADARIFHLVHKALVTNRQLSDSRIIVSSYNRVVLLVGETPTTSGRILAEQIARSTPGVYRVYNEITVGYPIPLTTRSKDSLITSQVRSSMLAKKGLESGSIRIVTENRVVYLMGIVTEQQVSLAVDVARRINGVNKVVKTFQYIH
ncbi:MAG: BON domain-containing protein [Legionella longbeachae]|nr:BON domain-containing protein [Legionella longbeachae]